MMPLDVAVAGGDSGIGRSVAVLMAKEGAKGVAIVYLPAEQPVSKPFHQWSRKPSGARPYLLGGGVGGGEGAGEGGSAAKRCDGG
jgi:NAD(P)-dependent dehydrogenase (short-subunit alcohol dehydrogenase family)